MCVSALPHTHVYTYIHTYHYVCYVFTNRQTVHYKREQDPKAQITKQTRELDRLPA